MYKSSNVTKYANLYNRARRRHAPDHFLSVLCRMPVLVYRLSCTISPSVLTLYHSFSHPRINKLASIKMYKNSWATYRPSKCNNACKVHVTALTISPIINILRIICTCLLLQSILTHYYAPYLHRGHYKMKRGVCLSVGPSACLSRAST